MKDFNDILERGVSDITVRKSLEAKLRSGKKLRIKHGVDPTTADLHLGYAVIYRKLRALQELGHTVIFLVGDFTGRFGDPTDKGKTREMRSKHDVEVAAKSYIDQVGLMLDTKKLEIRRNSEWYDKMSAERLLQIMSEFTVARMLERDMFAKRMKQGKEIGLHEPVYPVLQAWDSVELKSDATVIGTDQMFNELQARGLQERHGQAPQDVMSMDILVGTDGVQKMSQSLGNSISITAEPADMFGKIMSIPDGIVGMYFKLLTDVSDREIKDIKKSRNWMEAKKKLASLIVEQFHGKKGAGAGLKHFESVIQGKKEPENIQTKNIQGKDLKTNVDMVSFLFEISKSEARRLILQNAIECDGKKVVDPAKRPLHGVYKKGRRHYRKPVMVSKIALEEKINMC